MSAFLLDDDKEIEEAVEGAPEIPWCLYPKLPPDRDDD